MRPAKLSMLIFCGLMLLCALRPLILPISRNQPIHKQVEEQNWADERWNPSKQPLRRLPLTALEQRFSAEFPGFIGRFSDGTNVWVIRHISQPTRMLHSAIDCYRGLGYKVGTPQVIQQNTNTRWRCFEADSNSGSMLKLQVCERIFDESLGNWTDVSAWYWQTILQSGKHEWWAVTRVSKMAAGTHHESF